MTIALYIIGGIVGWCVCSVITAFLIKFINVCAGTEANEDAEDDEALIIAGPIGLLWLLIIVPLFALSSFAEWLYNSIINIPKTATTKKVKQKKVKRTLLENYNEFLQKD